MNNQPDQPDNTEFEAQKSFYTAKGVFTGHFMRHLKHEKSNLLFRFSSRIDASFEICRDIIKNRREGLIRGNEAVTRSELIDKVLTSLGFHFLPEIKSPGPAKTMPDYLLYRDENAKDEAIHADLAGQYSLAIGLLEAKRYEHPLGAVSRHETPGRFPHNQVRDYLADAIDPGGAPYFNWAVLTNGQKWRLYTRHYQASAYFEFDLARAVEDIERFKLFYLLFNAESFVPDDSGRCLLDQYRAEALEKQAALENDLRERVYDLLERLANGYADFEPNQISDDDLPDIYQASLIFLYRLLFILYAEGRDMLPVKEHGKGANINYRKRYSLVRLHNLLKENYMMKEEDGFLDYFEKLDKTFDLINGTEPRLNKLCKVPLYNGGLFNPQEFPLLKKWKVGDYSLSAVLRGLIFLPLPSERGKSLNVSFMETIDYSDLEIRQLGSIYEGLLEHHLERRNGRIALTAESSQRKTSGSYYTPDYVVRYIVDQTLKPLVEEIDQSEIVQESKVKRFKDNSFADQVLKLKVLDPAMGSGHFLVRATEYLADEIIYHPTTQLSLTEPPRGISHEELEKAHWRRRVVESCIYGVDLNPLAVELAKLSLWLTCISSDQPLSFLDHHFRCGNSLAGSNISELPQLATSDKGSSNLFELKSLDDAIAKAKLSLGKIRATGSEDLESVKNKEAIYRREVWEKLSPFRAIADLRSSAEFGLQIDDQIYRDMAQDLIDSGKGVISDELQTKHPDIWQNHLNFIDNYRSFHWELEFPDAFSERKAETGFDAVIGNPPYVRQETIKDMKDYLKKHYETYHGVADLYVYFIEQAMKLLKEERFAGLLVSNKWLRANYGTKLRGWLKMRHLQEIVDLGDLQVFKEATTYPCILRVAKSKPHPEILVSHLKKIDVNIHGELVVENRSTINLSSLNHSGWSLQNSGTYEILQKMKTAGIPLNEYLPGKVHYGIKTGLNKAFVIDESTRNRLISADPKNVEIIKPFLEGKDIKRYRPIINRKYLIFTRRGINIDDYPVIKGYLDPFKRRLTPRPQNWEGKWEGRKPGSYEWYEIQDTIDYYKEFETPKIIYPVICRRPEFSFDQQHLFTNDKCFFILTDDLYLLGCLNSRLSGFYFKHKLSKLRGGFFETRYIYLKNLPVVKLDTNSSSEDSHYTQIVHLVKQMLDLQRQLDEARKDSTRSAILRRIDKTDREIDRLVYGLFDLTEDEIALIESEGQSS